MGIVDWKGLETLMAIIQRILETNLEKELVRQFARGDACASRQLFEDNCDPLIRFVLRRSEASQEDAEEIVNDTFVTAVNLAHTFDGTCSIFTWLCSMARYRIIDFVRKQNSSTRIPLNVQVSIDDESKSAFRSLYDPNLSPEEIVERMDRVRIVQALMATLTEDQRDAVIMRYVEGFSISEIARTMRRTEKAVERLLERAKEKPRKEILNWIGDDNHIALCFGVLGL